MNQKKELILTEEDMCLLINAYLQVSPHSPLAKRLTKATGKDKIIKINATIYATLDE